MSCGNCGAVAIPQATICPECLLEEFKSNEWDVESLNRFTPEEEAEINTKGRLGEEILAWQTIQNDYCDALEQSYKYMKEKGAA